MNTIDMVIDEESQIDECEASEWRRYGTQLFVSVLTHPLDYARVLMQLGYEPISPHLGFTLVGTPKLMMPNIFQYANYIRQTDGIRGCYCGLVPKVLGNIVGTFCGQSLAELLCMANYNKARYLSTLDPELYEFQANLKRDILVSVTSTLVSQPFTVISLRMMAQFVGHEISYRSILAAIKEIYINEGFAGFFSGLMPKLIWNAGALFLTSTTIYVLNRYIIGENKLLRQYNAAVVPIAYSTVLYPFQVIATCTAVSGARLAAARPPMMPYYTNWWDCMKDLYGKGAFARGRSPFRRSIIGIDMNTMRRLKASGPGITKQQAD